MFCGGDRDKAQASFLKPLKGCTFLPCKKHVEDDISRKIADLGLNAIKAEILEDIFGCDKKMEKGIIDSERTEEFIAKVESVCTKWDKLETEIVDKSPQFSAYFRKHIEDDMKTGMLLPTRRRAGLRDEFFYNNAQESSNFVYKSKIREKKVVESTGCRPNLKCTWSEAIILYKNLVLQSRRDIQHAVLGKGPYTISNSYKDLVVTPVKWSAMSVEERGKHVAKLGISLTEETEEGKGREETPRQHELIGKFESSGLPDF